MDSVFAGGRVRLRAQITDGHRLGECAEGMPESLGNKQTFAGFGIQFDGIPLTERWGTHADVHHHVEDPAFEALDVLGLTGGNISEVNAAHGPRSRHGDVHLLQIEASPGGLNEDRLLERFQDHSPVVRPKDRSEGPHAID